MVLTVFPLLFGAEPDFFLIKITGREFFVCMQTFKDVCFIYLYICIGCLKVHILTTLACILLGLQQSQEFWYCHLNINSSQKFSFFSFQFHCSDVSQKIVYDMESVGNCKLIKNSMTSIIKPSLYLLSLLTTKLILLSLILTALLAKWLRRPSRKWKIWSSIPVCAVGIFSSRVTPET